MGKATQGRAGGAVVGLLLALAGCAGEEGAKTAALPEVRDRAAAAPDPPDRPTPQQLAARRAVDGYLQALARGDEAACEYLSERFLGRIARANLDRTSTRNDPDIWQSMCESHARDLTGHGELVLTQGELTVQRTSRSRAVVSVEVTLADSDSTYSYDDVPREATSTATYRLVRGGGRWHIDRISEDFFDEYGSDVVSSPISADFGGNLVLLRGCDVAGKDYCDPLFIYE